MFQCENRNFFPGSDIHVPKVKYQALYFQKIKLIHRIKSL